MPASLPGHKVNIVKTEQTTGKPFIFFRFAVMRYLDLNFDLQPLHSLGEDTEYNRSLHFVLCVNNTVRHKKTFLGIIFWTQTR